ncbi:DUF5133 domain-containing protein [Streptomyces sp. ODS28]|uniref:DUF5133 domain-containing protein n=1 Tax=Streptomyces sp. ODS28 TaxID=3136688 RepID=UPI0031F17F13
MLRARPDVLQNLLDEYEALTLLREQSGGPGLRRELDDLAYTLCVLTGTRQVEAALAEAREQLAAAQPQSAPPPPPEPLADLR